MVNIQVFKHFSAHYSKACNLLLDELLNQIEQFAYTVRVIFVKLTFRLPASGSWSIILNSILRIMLEICQTETIKRL